MRSFLSAFGLGGDRDDSVNVRRLVVKNADGLEDVLVRVRVPCSVKNLKQAIAHQTAVPVEYIQLFYDGEVLPPDERVPTNVYEAEEDWMLQRRQSSRRGSTSSGRNPSKSNLGNTNGGGGKVDAEGAEKEPEEDPPREMHMWMADLRNFEEEDPSALGLDDEELTSAVFNVSEEALEGMTEDELASVASAIARGSRARKECENPSEDGASSLEESLMDESVAFDVPSLDNTDSLYEELGSVATEDDDSTKMLNMHRRPPRGLRFDVEKELGKIRCTQFVDAVVGAGYGDPGAFAQLEEEDLMKDGLYIHKRARERILALVTAHRQSQTEQTRKKKTAKQSIEENLTDANLYNIGGKKYANKLQLKRAWEQQQREAAEIAARPPDWGKVKLEHFFVAPPDAPGRSHHVRVQERMQRIRERCECDEDDLPIRRKAAPRVPCCKRHHTAYMTARTELATSRQRNLAIELQQDLLDADVFRIGYVPRDLLRRICRRHFEDNRVKFYDDELDALLHDCLNDDMTTYNHHRVVQAVCEVVAKHDQEFMF